MLKVEHEPKPSKREKSNSERKPSKPKKEKKSKSKEETAKTKPVKLVEQPTRVLSRTRKPVNYMEDRSRSPSPYVPAESIESETATVDILAQQSSVPQLSIEGDDSPSLIVQPPTVTDDGSKMDQDSVPVTIAADVVVPEERPQIEIVADVNEIASPLSPPPPLPVVMTKKKAAASKANNEHQSPKTAKKSMGKKLLKTSTKESSKALTKTTPKATNKESSKVSNKESLAMPQKVQHDHPPIVLRISKVSTMLAFIINYGLPGQMKTIA